VQERFGKFGGNEIDMSEVQDKRKKIMEAINALPEDKLIYVEELINDISLADKNSIQNIYKKAVEKYHETLKKLAQ
jgi:hypothetical protein